VIGVEAMADDYSSSHFPRASCLHALEHSAACALRREARIALETADRQKKEFLAMSLTSCANPLAPIPQRRRDLSRHPATQLAGPMRDRHGEAQVTQLTRLSMPARGLAYPRGVRVETRAVDLAPSSINARNGERCSGRQHESPSSPAIRACMSNGDMARLCSAWVTS